MNIQKLNLIIILFFILIILISGDDNEIDEIDDIFSMIKNEDDFFKNLDFKNIITYEDNNYNDKMKKDKPLLIFIYRPFCPDCQKYISEYISLSEFLKNNKTDVILSKINAQDNPKFTKDFKVNEVPKVIFINKDNDVFEFKQEITKYNLIRFLNKKLFGDVLKFQKLNQIKKLIDDKKYNNKQVFILSTLSSDNNKEIFNKYASKNDREIFMECISKECYNEYKEDIIMFKNFDEKIIKYSDKFTNNDNKLDIDKLNEFIKRYSIEAGGILENEYFYLSKEYNKKMLIYFRDSKNNYHIKYDKIIKESGLKLMENIGYTFISDIHGNDFNKKLSEDFIIAEHELPTLLFIKKIDLREIKNCETYRITNVEINKLNKEYILNFIEDIKNNKILIDLKTQFPPLLNENDDLYYEYEPYKIVVGRTYDKDVIKEKKNVLVTFVDRKNECDLCNKYLKIIKEYQKMHKNDISFVVIDGANNEARNITFKENELPFIYFYTNAEINKKKYKYIPKEKEKISKEDLDLFIKKILKGNFNEEDL